MKPRITFDPLLTTRGQFQCKGRRPPYRYECYGFGLTRAEAYQNWASVNAICF